MNEKIIGEYIHLYKENYDKYRTERINEDNIKGPTIGKSIEENHRKMQQIFENKKSNANAKNVEDFLNMILSGNPKDIENLSLTKDQILAIEEKLYDLIVEGFNKNLKFDFSNLSVDKLTASGKNLRGINLTQKYNYVSTVKKLVESLDEMRNELEHMIKNGGFSAEEIKKIEADKKKLTENRAKIQSYINSAEKKQINTNKIKVTSGRTDVYSEVNEIINKYQSVDKKTIGDLAEVFVTYSFELLKQIMSDAGKEFQNIDKDSVVKGGNTGSSLVKGLNKEIANMIVEEVGTASLLSNEEVKTEDGKTIKMQASQNTIDGTIIFPEDNELAQIFGTNKLNMSIKNYKSGNLVHILGGANALGLLGLFGIDFTNHYLNYLVGNITDFSDGKEIQDEVKFSILIRALTGIRNVDNFQGDISELFVVNDRSRGEKGGFHVYSSYDILRAAERKIDKLVEFQGLPREGVIRNDQYGGKKPSQVSANRRIANILIALHKYKISVSIKTNEIN